MKEPELEDLLEQDLRSSPCHRGRIEAEPADARKIINPHPLDEFHGDHPGRGILIDREWDVRRGIAGKLAGSALHGAAFDREVELPLQAALELPGQRKGLVRSQEREMPLGKLGQVLEN